MQYPIEPGRFPPAAPPADLPLRLPAQPARRGARDRALRPRLNLALQGGGAHGAFTWGVLDALLADPRIELEGLSGSSAGALNAAILAEGWRKGGRDGARQSLADFWTAVGAQMPPGLVSQGHGEQIAPSATGRMLAAWAGQFSPAQLNPLDINPLREILAAQIDFAALRADCPFRLFIGTTQAQTGKLRLFRGPELTLDVLLASACLPRLHRAIEIDGKPYRDGGYAANPAVFPLLHECTSPDVLLVLLSPLEHHGSLATVEEIEARIADLAFSANFMREMRMFAQAIDEAQPSLQAPGRLERRLQALRFHMIDATDVASLKRSETKLLPHGPFLALLREQGRDCDQDWLDAHGDAIGRHATLDLAARFA